MTDAVPERFRGHDGRGGARGGRRRRSAPRVPLRGEEPYTHSVPFSHRSGERIEPLISLQWFCAMDELAKPAIEVVRDGRVRFIPEAAGRGLPRLAGADPALVHLAPALVGPPAARSGTAATPTSRRSTSASRPRRATGWEQERTCSTPGSAPRCGRSRRSAGRTPTPGVPGVLPDRRALDGPGHHLPLGRTHDHDLARVHRRGPVQRRLHPFGDPGAATAAGCRRASAPASTPSTRSPCTAPTRCASACSRCPRPRTSASPRPASSRAATSRTRCGTPLA